MVNNYLGVALVFDFDLTIFACTPVSPCPLPLGIDLEMTTPETKLLVFFSSFVLRTTGAQGRKLVVELLAIGARNSTAAPLFSIVASKYDSEHYLKQKAAQSEHMTYRVHVSSYTQLRR